MWHAGRFRASRAKRRARGGRGGGARGALARRRVYPRTYQRFELRDGLEWLPSAIIPYVRQKANVGSPRRDLSASAHAVWMRRAYPARA